MCLCRAMHDQQYSKACESGTEWEPAMLVLTLGFGDRIMAATAFE